MSDTLILIPARLQSSRFPRKLLANLAGKSVLQRVLENCQKSGFDSAVVTDHDDIEHHMKEVGQVVRVDDDVVSGSERIGLALERFFSHKQYHFVINVQGDEPFLKGEEIRRLGDFHRRCEADICTLVKKRSRSDASFEDPNIVKAVYLESSALCPYFSRSPVPFDREGDGQTPWFQHIGVYSYRPNALKRFLQEPMSTLESCEKLEQLRALEMGMTIAAMQTELELIGIDTEEDLKRANEVWSE